MDRRHTVKGRHPVYRVLRLGILGIGTLALLMLPLITLVAALYPEWLGGGAYIGLIVSTVVITGVVLLFMLRRLLVMFLDRRGRIKGGKLHMRLLGVFATLAIAPALLVAVTSIFLLNMGIENWFSAKVNSALDESLQVASAYLAEHEKNLVAEIQGLATEGIWQQKPWLMDLRPWLANRAETRRLDGLAVVDGEGVIVSQAFEFAGFTLGEDVLDILHTPEAQAGVMSRRIDNRVLAVAPVGQSMWLVAQRWINPTVLARVDQTTGVVKEYENLRHHRGRIRLIVTLLLVLLSVSALAGAVWTGIRLATRIVRPVTALVHGTNRVSTGDLDVRLTPEDEDELGILTQAFNRMTQQLATQRDLVDRKNKELDDRRKQMEAVLTGVTAAVIGVDTAGIVRNANHTAATLLKLKPGSVLKKEGDPLHTVWEAFVAHPRPLAQQQVRWDTDTGDVLTLLVRMVPQYVEGGRVGGVVMTCDDITPLIGAQRLAAWQDVARRLAHEIKNPLTPIQLSAERLKRRYLDKIPAADKELFAELTTTIVQQAEDMRRMTNEFSDFARMPTAHMQEEDMLEMLRHVVTLQKTGRSDIMFETDIQVKGKTLPLWCDRAQLNRVLVNIVENAVNAIEERPVPAGKKKLDQGIVTLVVKKPQADKVHLTVLDNGKGLPPDVEVGKLFDPYVTTRERGTGLGLAIVKKVMDEHEGTVRLMRRAEGGTAVELTFAVKPMLAAHGPSQTNKETNAHEHTPARTDKTPKVRNPRRR